MPSILREPRKGDELRIGDHTLRITHAATPNTDAYAAIVRDDGTLGVDMRINDLEWALAYAQQNPLPQFAELPDER